MYGNNYFILMKKETLIYWHVTLGFMGLKF